MTYMCVECVWGCLWAWKGGMKNGPLCVGMGSCGLECSVKSPDFPERNLENLILHHRVDSPGF